MREAALRERQVQRAKQRVLLLALWRLLAPLLLFICALGCLVTAAFMHDTVTGLVATGAALLLLEWRTSSR